LKKNIKRSQDRQRKKIIENSIEENYQKDIQQKHYTNGIIGDLIRSIGSNWKEIGDVRREYNKREKEHWK